MSSVLFQYAKPSHLVEFYKIHHNARNICLIYVTQTYAIICTNKDILVQAKLIGYNIDKEHNHNFDVLTDTFTVIEKLLKTLIVKR